MAERAGYPIDPEPLNAEKEEGIRARYAAGTEPTVSDFAQLLSAHDYWKNRTDGFVDLLNRIDPKAMEGLAPPPVDPPTGPRPTK